MWYSTKGFHAGNLAWNSLLTEDSLMFLSKSNFSGKKNLHFCADFLKKSRKICL